jgi:hypothetical protein
MRYFKGDPVPNLDTNLIISAEDSKAKATTLFNENIDLACYSTEDYKRLRNFLINWYASLRSFSSIMRNASDVRSLPEDHLNQLINSFGFVDSLEDITKSNKIDFFYDLVNLYKIKGTPESIERVVSYFGIPDVEIIEYWLQYDKSYNLIFHPVIISSNVVGISVDNIPFKTFTDVDPHWFLTEDNINQLFLNNKIAFPSKTPYFGLRPLLYISGSSINSSLGILFRIIQDMYTNYLVGIIPNRDIVVSDISIKVSILDLYLGWVYAFNSVYPKITDSLDDSILIYNGPMNVTYNSIIQLYDSLSGRLNINTRAELKYNQDLLNFHFTRLKSTSFLTDLNTAGNVLNTTNPDFKNLIDINLPVDKGTYILKILIKNLSSWIKKNISSYSPDLSIITFGFSSLNYVTDVVNFFKPYRSRLVTVEHNFIIKNPLLDTVIPEDFFSTIYQEDNFIDFDTADSIPSFRSDELNLVTSTPPTELSRRICDIYIDEFGIIKYVFDTSGDFTLIKNPVYSSPPIGGYRILNIYLEIPIDGVKVLYIEYYTDPVTEDGVSTNIISNPPISYYTVNDIYVNDEGQFEIEYDDVPIIDLLMKKYYSRDTYDNGSYFDIGASIDLNNFIINIEQNNEIIQNYHKGDATFDFNYKQDSLGNVVYVLADSGWSNFDSGMVFDSSMQSDIVQIKVFELLSQISQTENDGSSSSKIDITKCELKVDA